MDPLPHWDMTPYFSGLDRDEFTQAFAAMVESLANLEALFDQVGVSGQNAFDHNQPSVKQFERVLAQLNQVLDQVFKIRAYIYSFISTDSRSSLAQARWSEFRPNLARIEILSKRFSAWVGTMDVQALLQASSLAAQHAYVLHKAQVQAQHLMSPESEVLASELTLSGGGAWSRFYGDYSSQLVVPFTQEQEQQHLPMSALRNLAYDPDRNVRRQAYEAELCAWEQAAMPIAAALNQVKGHVQTLAMHRGWESPLQEALFTNNVDRASIEAMHQAAQESFPDFRRYLQAKAALLDQPKLTWFDLFAPVGAETRFWSYEQAEHFIVKHFGSFSTRLQALAQRAFREGWIDAEPRAGKLDGAFCMRIVPGESRILANYQPVYGGVSTLAHELGHAYHNLALAERTYLQRLTPMTMAETASIFCETIVREAALKESTLEEQLAILEASLQDTCQVVVDISSRFQFEQKVFEKRQARDLAIEEFNQLMLEAQQATYGDGLDPSYLHPYMWAAKSHYYLTELSYYNFPYMFGMLFALGLYAYYQAQPEDFLRSYDDLLASTGMYSAEDLTQRFGIDVRTPDFWRASLDVVRAEIDRFEQLVQARS